jgi:hypothetical protein
MIYELMKLKVRVFFNQSNLGETSAMRLTFSFC